MNCRLRQSCTGWIALILLLLPFLSPDVQAASKLIINPLAAVGARWDSNYFQNSVDEKAIYSFLLQPGIELGYQTEKTRIAFSGTLDGYIYDGDEAPDDFLGFTVDFLLDGIAIPKRLFYGLSNITRRSRETELIDQLDQTNTRELNTINIFQPYLIHETKRFSSSLDYENKLVYFEEGFGEDSIFNKGGLQTLYKLNRTYQLGPRFEVSNINYDQESVDYTSLKGFAVLNRIGNYLDLAAGAGYHGRTFDDPKNTEFNLVPWFLTATNGTTSGLKKTTIYLDLRYDMNDNAALSEGYFAGPQLFLDVQYQLNKRLSAGVNGFIGRNDYEFSDRNDDVGGLGISANYRLYRSIGISVKLGYDRRDSNDDTFDYNNVYTYVKLNYLTEK